MISLRDVLNATSSVLPFGVNNFLAVTFISRAKTTFYIFHIFHITSIIDGGRTLTFAQFTQMVLVEWYLQGKREHSDPYIDISKTLIEDILDLDRVLKTQVF